MRLTCGDWTIDNERRVLVRAGTPLRIEPKAFELLSILINERPKVLSKVQLLQRIWPDAIVTGASLTRLIKHLRDALGDDAGAQRYIRTVHRFGYGFAAEITEVGDRLPGPCRLVGRDGLVLLRRGENVVGRATHDVRSLDDPSISRRHASIVVGDHEVSIEDLGSKNGTFVGSERLDCRRRLRDGDTVRFGLVTFVFKRSSPTSATRTAPNHQARGTSANGRS